MRDLDQWAPGFQFLAGKLAPSHAYAKPVGIGCEVTVLGMRVCAGEIVHADRHGAVGRAGRSRARVPEAARAIAEREARILAVARAPGCTAEKLIAVFA